MGLVQQESGWFLDDLELPIPPSSIERRVIRKPDLSKVQFGFPVIFNPAPQTFDLILKGWIWPEFRAFNLDQLSRSADTEIIQLKEPISQGATGLYQGLYAIDRSFVKIDGPQFTEFLGKTVQAWQYEITLVQFADQGANQDSIEGGLDLDEVGLGFGDINISVPELNFDDFNPFGGLGLDLKFS